MIYLIEFFCVNYLAKSILILGLIGRVSNEYFILNKRPFPNEYSPLNFIGIISPR